MRKEIYNIIHMSTSHIKKETFDYLNDCQTYPISYGSSENGWGCVVLITESDLDPEEYEDMPDLLDCMMFAFKNDCLYIRFDSDAPVYDELPVYEW